MISLIRSSLFLLSSAVLVSAPVWAQSDCNTTDPIEVELEAEIDISKTERQGRAFNAISLAGVTNLPDGFQIAVSTCRFYLGADDARYCLRPINIPAPVAQGEFSAEFLILNQADMTTAVEAYAQATNDPAAQEATVDEDLTITLLATPRAQSQEIQCRIGGSDSQLLQGPHSREATLGFRVVERDYTLPLPL